MTNHGRDRLQQQDDETLIIGWNKDTVRDAPNVDPDGHLSDEEEARLYDHYRLHTTFGAGNVGGRKRRRPSSNRRPGATPQARRPTTQ